MQQQLSTKQPVQLWNGIQFSYATSEAEAAALVKAGTHQRTRGLAGHQLKHPAAFQAAADLLGPEPAVSSSKPKAHSKPPRRGKGTYKTREMKAEK